MSSRELSLVPFQVDVVSRALSHFVGGTASTRGPTVAVVSPTGSGKTVIAKSIVCPLIKYADYQGALIVVPNQDIRDNFKDDPVLVFPQEPNCHPWRLEAFRMIKIAQESDIEERVHTFVMEGPPAPDRPQILVATHQAVVAAFKDGGPSSWEGWILVVDETHRATVKAESETEDSGAAAKVDFGETEIGKFVEKVRDQGGATLLMSACGTRGTSLQPVYPHYQDGKPTEDTLVIQVPYTDAVEQLGAPENLHIEVIGPNEGGDLTDAEREHGLTRMYVRNKAELEGRYPHRDPDTLDTGLLHVEDAQRVASHWQKQGLPPAFFRVTRVINAPVMMQALHDAWLETKGETPYLVNGTTKTEGYSDLDPRHQGNRIEFNDALKKEREDESPKDPIAAIVVCGRGLEGTNWPRCSHYYNVGSLPQNIGTLQQTLGRPTRPKRVLVNGEWIVKKEPNGEDHPYPDDAFLFCFVPKIHNAQKLRQNWHETSLLVSCWITNHETALPFLDKAYRAIRDRAVSGTKRRSKRWERIMALLDQILPGTASVAVARKKLTEAYICAAAELGPKHPQLAARVLSNLLEDPKVSAQTKMAATFLSLSSSEDAQQELIEKLAGTLRQSSKRPPREVDPAYEEALKATAQKFEHITQVDIGAVHRIASKSTGASRQEIERELHAHIIAFSQGGRSPRPCWRQVRETIHAWHRRHAIRSGQTIHGDLSLYFGFPKGTYTAEKLQNHLRARQIRGQPEHIGNLRDALEDTGWDSL